MRQLLQGWSKLVGGNAANGVLQLAIFAIAAHALDLAMLGTLIVIQAYVRMIDGLLNFQSVSVLTNFLAQAQVRRDEAHIAGLMKVGLLVDFGTAGLASLVAIAGLPLIAPFIGLDAQWTMLAALFSCVIATRAFGALEAGLRCFDRFGAIGLRPVFVSVMVLIGTVWAWAAGGDAQVFLVVWLVGETLANLSFLGWAIVSLRRDGLTGLRRANAHAAVEKCPNFWQMMWQSNVTSGLRLLSQEGDIVIVSAVLGPVAVSLLRAAKNLANLVGQVGRPLQQIVSAQLSRLVAMNKQEAALAYAARMSMIAGGAALIISALGAVFGEFALAVFFGDAFRPAGAVLVMLLITAALFMFGIANMPLALALNRSDIALRSTLWGTVPYFFAMGLLIEPLGLLGVGVAHIAFNSTWMAFGWIVLRREVSGAPTLAGTPAKLD